MKTTQVLTLALLAGLTATTGAARQTAADLEPSLKFLNPVSAAMPSPRGVVFYEAMPDASGRVIAGIGHSQFVRGWFRQMDPILPRFAKMDERLRLDVGVYGDTVREEGQEVLAAAANLKKGLIELDAATNGRVLDFLGDYNDAVKATRIARSEYESARKRAEEASHLLDASDAAAKACNAVVERKRLEAQRAAERAKIQKASRVLNALERAIGTMAGGPQGVAAYLAGEAKRLTIDGAKAVIIDTLFAGTQETIYQIGLKIEAIDQSLQELECKPQASALKAARAGLEGRMIDTLVAFSKIVEHRSQAWRAVDRLGTLKHPKTQQPLPFFVRVQAYNDQVNVMGSTVFEAVDAYLELLASDPLSRGELVLAYINEDVQTVQRERQKRDPAGEWLSRASATRAYVETYAKWYAGETRRGQAILADLREGRHLDFVDRMLARATKELGGTVSYEHIIKSNAP
jgi:hypothetical protein